MTSTNNLHSSIPILASSSPRRCQWLQATHLPFEVMIPEIDEKPLPNETTASMVERLACSKAESIATINPDRWVIAADTTVSIDNYILGKPTSKSDAVRMLLLIQGRNHVVQTGLCLRRNSIVYTFVDTTEVFFRPMTLNQINWYVETDEVMDKAGAYSIQGIAALFIERIQGSFATVTGFPIERFSKLISNLGLLETWLGIS